MRKSGRVVSRALAVMAALGLAYLVVAYAAGITDFFGRSWLWVLLGLAMWAAASVVLGLVIGAAIRNRDLQAPSPVDSSAAQVPSAGAGAHHAAERSIPSPTLPGDGETGAPLSRPARRPPAAG